MAYELKEYLKAINESKQANVMKGLNNGKKRTNQQT